MVFGIFDKPEKEKKVKTIQEQWQEMNAEMVEHLRARRVTEASRLGKELVEFVDKRFRRNTPERATSYSNMGMVFLFQREYDIAEKCFSDALEIRRKIFGSDHNEVAVILLNMAQLYKLQAQEIMEGNVVEVEAEFGGHNT